MNEKKKENVKIKYYYSPSAQIRNIPTVTGADGVPTFIPKNLRASIHNVHRITVASYYDDAENVMKFGVAVCSPEDRFEKKIGRELALKRALTSPEKTVCAIDRSNVANVSRKYADELIKKHLHRHRVHFEHDDDSENPTFYSNVHIII